MRIRDEAMRIENVERLNPLFVRADIETGGERFESVLIAKRKGHYAIVILEGAENREIALPDSFDGLLDSYFGLVEDSRIRSQRA
jgi:hypothetical protein